MLQLPSDLRQFILVARCFLDIEDLVSTWKAKEAAEIYSFLHRKLLYPASRI